MVAWPQGTGRTSWVEFSTWEHDSSSCRCPGKVFQCFQSIQLIGRDGREGIKSIPVPAGSFAMERSRSNSRVPLRGIVPLPKHTHTLWPGPRAQPVPLKELNQQKTILEQKRCPLCQEAPPDQLSMVSIVPRDRAGPHSQARRDARWRLLDTIITI